MIKVLVVEDSPVVRELLVRLLESDPEIRVVGAAKNGIEAVTMAANLKPDVITMDIQMPKMDGVEATKVIMEQSPTRIIVVSASFDQQESRPAFEAIKAGALTLVDKPRGFHSNDFESIKNNLIKTIKIMSKVKVVTRWRSSRKIQAPPKTGGAGTKLIAIGASTGGPAALSQILKGFPADLPVPIIIVQHMTSGFGPAFASWLNTESPLTVKIPQVGDELLPGTVFVAPDNYHIGINKSGKILLTSQQTSYNHHRPSINYMFETVAKSYGPKALGVLLTGMGEDGALGLREIKSAGGKTVAQDERTSVVFGMPKAAIALGAADRVVPLDKMACTVLSML